jgi:hypothetical protein
LKKYKGNKFMKWFMCNETERIPVKFPDVPAFISNAGSDTDDNQNHDIIQPSDNDGDNETEQLINVDECQDHDHEMIIHKNNGPSATLNYPSKTRKSGRARPRKRLVTPHRRMRLKERTPQQERGGK